MHVSLYDIFDFYLQSSTLKYVDPCDKSIFPGVDKHLMELKSWDWIFAKTPPFSIQRSFQEEFSKAVTSLEVSLNVTKGKLHNLDLKVEQPAAIDPKVFIALKVGMEGTKFSRSEINKNLSLVKMEWIASKLYTVVTHSVLDWILLCILETVSLHHGQGPTVQTNGSGKTFISRKKSQATW